VADVVCCVAETGFEVAAAEADGIAACGTAARERTRERKGVDGSRC